MNTGAECARSARLAPGAMDAKASLLVHLASLPRPQNRSRPRSRLTLRPTDSFSLGMVMASVVEIVGAPHRVRRALSGKRGDVHRALKRPPQPDIVVVDYMSEGGRQAAEEAGVGWADEHRVAGSDLRGYRARRQVRSRRHGRRRDRRVGGNGARPVLDDHRPARLVRRRRHPRGAGGRLPGPGATCRGRRSTALGALPDTLYQRAGRMRLAPFPSCPGHAPTRTSSTPESVVTTWRNTSPRSSRLGWQAMADAEETRSRVARVAAQRALVRIVHYYGERPEFVVLGGLMPESGAHFPGAPVEIRLGSDPGSRRWRHERRQPGAPALVVPRVRNGRRDLGMTLRLARQLAATSAVMPAWSRDAEGLVALVDRECVR